MKRLSFNFLEWAKKHIKIPSKEEAKKILKNHSKKEILDAYKEVYNVFKTKKSFNLQSIKKSLLIASALFVLLGNVAQAGLPSVDKLEEKYQSFFDSLDKEQVTVVHDKGFAKKMFLNAMEEIEFVYDKIKVDSEFKEDALALKTVIDKYSEVKKNINNLEDKDLIKAKTIAVRLQADAYFGYLAGVAKDK